MRKVFDIVISGGEVVTSSGVSHWDVGIADGRIAAIGLASSLRPHAARVVEATGMVVVPGGVDPHVHTNLVVPRVDGSSARSAPPRPVSQAALFGGTTTLVDFATWSPGLTLADAIQEQESLWKDAYADYSLHVLLRGEIPPQVLAEIPDCVAAGYPSFKLFTTDIRPNRKGLMMSAGHVRAVSTAVAKAAGVLVVHAEDDDLVMHAYGTLPNDQLGYENMARVHTSLSEELAFRRVIGLAANLESCAVYFVHVSAASGVNAIAEARASGLPIYGETLHNYLAFTEQNYREPDGVVYHTYPSLKTEDDRRALWSALLNGTLSTVATDEVSTPRSLKVAGKTVFDATGGHVGVETRMAVVFTEGVVTRNLSLERFVEITSTNAARLLGMYPRKGVIAVGSDADVAILNPSARRTLRAMQLHDSDYSPWDGWVAQGWPITTIRGGRVVVDDGRWTGEAPSGRRVGRRMDARILNRPIV